MSDRSRSRLPEQRAAKQIRSERQVNGAVRELEHAEATLSQVQRRLRKKRREYARLKAKYPEIAAAFEAGLDERARRALGIES